MSGCPSLPYRLAGLHLSGRAAATDFSDLQQISVIRDAQGLAGVLLRHQNADPTGADLLCQVE